MRRMISAALAILTAALLSAAKAGDEPAPANPPPEIKVIMATPDGNHLLITDDQAHLDVIIENVSGHPIKLYQSWNSWGWATVKLEWEVNGNKGTIVRDPNHQWTRNFPSTTTLPPGGVTIFPVTLRSDWQNWPDFKQGAKTKMTVKAVYDSTEKMPDGEKTPAGWEGKGSSEPIAVEVEDARSR